MDFKGGIDDQKMGNLILALSSVSFCFLSKLDCKSNYAAIRVATSVFPSPVSALNRTDHGIPLVLSLDLHAGSLNNPRSYYLTAY